MRRATFFKMLTAAAIVGGSGADLMAQGDDAGRLIAGNTAFAVDLYGKVREGGGNRFLSPFSVSNALAMTYAGARGQTADEMAKALHFTLPPDRLHPASAEINRRLDGEPGKPRPFELSVA